MHATSTDPTAYRLRTAAAAAYIGSTKSTLEKMRVSGDGPPFMKLGRVVVYDTSDIDSWLASRRRRSTSDQGLEASMA